MGRILVVDDEPNVLAAFRQFLGGQGHDVIAASRAQAALDQLQNEPFDLAVVDICMPGISGLDALDRIRQMQPRLPVILVTGQGTMETAIEATKRGAFDYHLKPFEPEEMLRTIDRALESGRLMKGRVDLDPQTAACTGDAIVGRSAGMQQVYKTIGRVAPNDATVLICGESGTGKELVARAIYQHSRRSDQPLMVVNCVALPETLLESELFGYEKGAFTGAASRRLGKFEQADGGTIFLDEIGDMPLGIQAKILRLLQEKTFQRLGGNETIRVDVRVLAATNRNLEAEIAAGTFRDDLYHRLNVVTIPLPPLRERKDDVPRLVDYFLGRFARELNVAVPPLAPEALVVLQQYSWPGNVRELEHAIHRAMILTGGHAIQAADLPISPEKGAGLPQNPAWREENLLPLVRAYLDSFLGDHAHEHLLEQVERLLLSEALRRTQGNQTHAAKLLGLARPTFHAKLQKYRLQDQDLP